MPLRTKIDIDANPGDFQASVAALNKYRDAIQKSSSQWVKYGTSVKSALKTASEMTAHLQQHSLTLDHVSATQRRFGDAARSAGSIFANMARNTGSIANNLARSATSLFDIFTITGAIGALAGLGGGLFGLEALARGVAGSRKEALGLGVDYGRMSAFELNFGRFGDAAAMLGAVSGGIYDVTSPAYVGLLASGVGARKGDAAQTAVELLRRLPQIFAGTQEGLIGPKAEALGLTEFWKLPEIIRMLHSPDELNSQIGHYKQDKLTLAISANAQLAWSKFDTALARAGLNIEKTLADQLVPLSEPLQHLSKSFVDIVDTFAHSQPVGDALKAVEGDLEWFAGNVGSPEFKDAAGKFLDGLSHLAPIAGKIFEAGKIAARTGWFVGRVLNPSDPYNKTIGGVVSDILNPGSAPAPDIEAFGVSNGPSIRHHTRGYLDPSTHPAMRTNLAPVYDDPSIRARQKMKRPQTTSYLDQFQGLRDQRQIIVSDQTHNNVVISSA